VGKPFIVAISGNSGSGKSTLAERFDNAIWLRFDDYYRDEPLLDFDAWIDAGGDPNVIWTPGLAAALRDLSRGGSIDYPSADGDPHAVGPADIVFVEDAFGRTRDSVAEFYDFLVHLDVPMEVALARRLLRDMRKPDQTDEEALRRATDDLERYLRMARRVYVRVVECGQAEADLVVDATATGEDVLAQVEDAVRVAIARRGHF